MTQNTEKTLTSLLHSPTRPGVPFSDKYVYSHGAIPKVTFRKTRAEKVIRRPAS